jgi:hypothetical protein
MEIKQNPRASLIKRIAGGLIKWASAPIPPFFNAVISGGQRDDVLWQSNVAVQIPIKKTSKTIEFYDPDIPIHRISLDIWDGQNFDRATDDKDTKRIECSDVWFIIYRMNGPSSVAFKDGRVYLDRAYADFIRDWKPEEKRANFQAITKTAAESFRRGDILRGFLREISYRTFPNPKTPYS